MPQGEYDHVPDWAFTPRPGPFGDPGSGIIQPGGRRTRSVVRYGERPDLLPGGDPRFLTAEELVANRVVMSCLRPDEYLAAVHRRGVYAACRTVVTVGAGDARKAGL